LQTGTSNAFFLTRLRHQTAMPPPSRSNIEIRPLPDLKGLSRFRKVRRVYCPAGRSRSECRGRPLALPPSQNLKHRLDVAALFVKRSLLQRRRMNRKNKPAPSMSNTMEPGHSHHPPSLLWPPTMTHPDDSITVTKRTANRSIEVF